MAPFGPTVTDVVCPMTGSPPRRGSTWTNQSEKTSSTATSPEVDTPARPSALRAMRRASSRVGRPVACCGAGSVVGGTVVTGTGVHAGQTEFGGHGGQGGAGPTGTAL